MMTSPTPVSSISLQSYTGISDHISDFSMNAMGKPIITLQNGQRYMITVPGKDPSELRNVNPMEWATIAQLVDRMLTEKNIWNNQPLNFSTNYDGLVISESGIKYGHNSLIAHTNGTNTTGTYQQLIQVLNGKLVAASPTSTSSPSTGTTTTSPLSSSTPTKLSPAMQNIVKSAVAEELRKTANILSVSTRIEKIAGARQSVKDQCKIKAGTSWSDSLSPDVSAFVDDTINEAAVRLFKDEMKKNVNDDPKANPDTLKERFRTWIEKIPDPVKSRLSALLSDDHDQWSKTVKELKSKPGLLKRIGGKVLSLFDHA